MGIASTHLVKCSCVTAKYMYLLFCEGTGTSNPSIILISHGLPIGMNSTVMTSEAGPATLYVALAKLPHPRLSSVTTIVSTGLGKGSTSACWQENF